MRRTLIALALALGMLACGGDDDSDAAQTSSTTTEVPTETVVVRVVAQQSGLSWCTEAIARSGLDIGRGSPVRLLADGDVVGTGTYDLTYDIVDGPQTCDWTVRFRDIDISASMYEVQDGKGMLVATLDPDGLESQGWRAELTLTTQGDIRNNGA